MNNDLQTFLIIIVVVLLGYFVLKGFGIGIEQSEEVIEGDSEGALNLISEHRTFVVNQLIALFGFWFNQEVTKDSIKLTAPAFNQNTLYFFHDDMEIVTHFDWNNQMMTIQTVVYNDQEGYITAIQGFSMKNHLLDVKGIHKFVQKAQAEYYELHELSADDVIEVIKQLKALNQPFQDDAAAKCYYFNTMADLTMLARRKKFRRDKKFMKIYSSLIHHMWSTTGEEFIEFLNKEDEPLKDKETTKE